MKLISILRYFSMAILLIKVPCVFAQKSQHIISVKHSILKENQNFIDTFNPKWLLSYEYMHKGNRFQLSFYRDTKYNYGTEGANRDIFIISPRYYINFAYFGSSIGLVHLYAHQGEGPPHLGLPSTSLRLGLMHKLYLETEILGSDFNNFIQASINYHIGNPINRISVGVSKINKELRAFTKIQHIIYKNILAQAHYFYIDGTDENIYLGLGYIF